MTPMQFPGKVLSLRPLLRLIWITACLSLAVTALRLLGELRHWAPAWFSSATGGYIPSGISWLVGITWLAIPFGAYFGLKLYRGGYGPPALERSIGYGAFGVIVLLACDYLLHPIILKHVSLEWPRTTVFLWLYIVIAALLQFSGWSSLSRTLLIYGFAARIPVAIIMFFAFRGHWGTHYDYVGLPPQFQMSFWPAFLWLAFFPQLVFWVSFTVLVGVLSGSIAAAARRQQG